MSYSQLTMLHDLFLIVPSIKQFASRKTGSKFFQLLSIYSFFLSLFLFSFFSVQFGFITSGDGGSSF